MGIFPIDRYGMYDIIAKVKADSMDKFKETITLHSRRVENVKSIQTMIEESEQRTLCSEKFIIDELQNVYLGSTVYISYKEEKEQYRY